MEEASSTEQPEGGLGPVALAVTFLAAAVLWLVAVQVVVGVVVVVILLVRGGPVQMMADPAFVETALTPGLLGAASLVQATGMGLIALAVARFSRFPFREMLGLRKAPVGPWAIAGLGGLVVGMFPGWLAYQISERVPLLDLGNLEMLAEALLASTLVERVVLVVAICLFAPLLEEVVFRGVLWNLIDRAAPTWVAWLVTSALFACWHLDPVHVIAVFFVGLFLGWVRWVGGSLWPCVLAHFVNNTLAVVVTFAAPDATGGAPEWYFAAGSVVATTGLAGIGWLTRARHER